MFKSINANLILGLQIASKLPSDNIYNKLENHFLLTTIKKRANMVGT